MVDIKEITKDVGLTVALGPLGPTVLALKKALKKHKEAKTKKDKEYIQKLIDDLKKEIAQKKARATSRKQQKRVGYSPHQINPMTQQDYENIEWIRKNRPNITPAERLVKMPIFDKEGYITMPNPKGNGTIRVKPMKKGGSVKTSKYSKGGGVRKSKYSL